GRRDDDSPAQICARATAIRAATVLRQPRWTQYPGADSNTVDRSFRDIHRSPSTLAEEHDPDGLDEDQQIEQERMVLDVEKIVLEFLDRLFQIAAIGVAYLRPAGEPGLDAVPDRVERDLLGKRADKRGPLGSRTDEAHLPAQDIDQLRQLVNARMAHESPHRGNARIVDARPGRPPVLFGVLGHAPELEQREFVPMPSDPFLPVNDRGATIKCDQH